MKALMLYILFVAIGVAASLFVGFYVERQTSSAVSLIVFLAMFFANFAVAWILTILAMDGTLRDGQGRAGQLDAERQGRALYSARRRA
jgi:hypothetical protein